MLPLYITQVHTLRKLVFSRPTQLRNNDPSLMWSDLPYLSQLELLIRTRLSAELQYARNHVISKSCVKFTYSAPKG